MRYNVHSPCTFHNRIAKSISGPRRGRAGRDLGLPSAAQAQTPAAPKVTGTGDGTTEDGHGTITVERGGRCLVVPTLTKWGWMVEYTEPGVPWADATMTSFNNGSTDATGSGPLANDPRIHHGVWRFRVSYWNKAVQDDACEATGLGALEHHGWCAHRHAERLWDYHHGPPAAAPTGLTAYDAGPDARRLVWDEMDGLTYESRYTADPTDDDEWTDWKDRHEWWRSH